VVEFLKQVSMQNGFNLVFSFLYSSLPKMRVHINVVPNMSKI
jgi:hypothetical protein